MSKKIKWQIGCSGFYYKEWREVFYPKGLIQKKWFEFYCEHFNTLELNVTFYRFPEIDFLKTWYNKSPDKFLFSVKAPRLITHYKQFSDTDKLLQDFYGTVREGLKTKLGCILFQLPARIEYTPEKLRHIVDSMDSSFKNVIEFRHISWWNDEVYSTLKKNKIAFCGVSISKLPDHSITTTDLAYYRFHGVPVLYVSRYTDEQLMKIADEIIADENISSAFIYFNNTASASAIKNATWLKNYCEDYYRH